MSRKTGTVTVNGQPIEFGDADHLLEVVRRAHIDLPTLCYFPSLSAFGGCRQCIVEVEDGTIVTTCVTLPQDGMKIVPIRPRCNVCAR